MRATTKILPKLAILLLLLVALFQLKGQRKDSVMEQANVYAIKYNIWANKRNTRLSSDLAGKLIDYTEIKAWSEAVEAEQELEKIVKKEYENQ